MASAVQDDDDEWGDNLQEQIDEVTALESIYCDSDVIIVVTSPEEDSTQSYTLQMNVAVELPRERVTVNTWVPYEYDIQTCENMVASLQSPNRPNFQRTTSGKRWESAFQLQHLTPIHLNLTLPRTYPSAKPPALSMECVWLDAHQMSSLCAQLDALWGEAQNSPVLFIWLDWLQNNTFSHLILEDSIILTRQPEAEAEEDVDSRVTENVRDLHDDLVNLLRHDLECAERVFAQDTHTCEICFDDKQGREFIRLPQCGHHFCRECLQMHCQLHTKEGSVHQLTCADNECKEHLPQYVIKSLLGDEEYDRWERLNLTKTLESMGDVEYCPRCQFVVVIERDSKDNLGHCLQCTYSFCTTCKDPWHASEPCTDIEAKLEQFNQRERGNRLTDKEDDFQRKQKNLKMEYLNIAAVLKIAKPCPKCRIDIFKYEGCNKVTCSACGTCMCWKCGVAIIGYAHFNGPDSRCALFFVPGGGGEDIPHRYTPNRHLHAVEQRRIRQALQLQPQNAQLLARCPRCRVQNLKHGTNNHVRCWNCRANSCFQCRALIQGSIAGHYNAAKPCDQHSRDTPDV